MNGSTGEEEKEEEEDITSMDGEVLLWDGGSDVSNVSELVFADAG